MITKKPLAVEVISSTALALWCLLEEIKEQLLVCRDQHAISRLDHLIRAAGSKADTLN